MTASFWQDVDARRARWDVLAHPFYQRWVSGALKEREFALYASEYEHAVVAIASASRRAAALQDGPLASHAEEEDEHVSLWRAFAKEVGWGGWGAWAYGEDPLPATEECARVWTGDTRRGLPEHLVTLYSIESSQAAISRVKLEGLLDHYGFEQGPATEYFRVHALLDIDHALLMRSELERQLDDADREGLLEQAEAVHRSYWGLLTISRPW